MSGRPGWSRGPCGLAGPKAGKVVSLALQGGGAHGAFTWGVLDALLEDGGFDLSAVSGTSAGALNAACLVTGLAEGGADGARARLQNLWRHVSEHSPLGAVEHLGSGHVVMKLQSMASP